MNKKYWMLDFVITDLQYIENHDGLLFVITFRDDEQIETKLSFIPNSDNYIELYNATCGYSPDKSLSKCPEEDLIGRIVKGTLFENENRLGQISYNIAYFKEADKSRLCDLFFQRPQKFWSEERLEEFKLRMNYVSYIKQTFGYDLHESIIAAAIENGKELDY